MSAVEYSALLYSCIAQQLAGWASSCWSAKLAALCCTFFLHFLSRVFFASLFLSVNWHWQNLHQHSNLHKVKRNAAAAISQRAEVLACLQARTVFIAMWRVVKSLITTKQHHPIARLAHLAAAAAASDAAAAAAAANTRTSGHRLTEIAPIALTKWTTRR